MDMRNDYSDKHHDYIQKYAAWVRQEKIIMKCFNCYYDFSPTLSKPILQTMWLLL
jgi:hypothetical protein